MIFLITPSGRAHAEEPRIYLIELFGTNQVLLHFNTDPNRTYTVQFLDVSSLGPSLAGLGTQFAGVPRWSNLAVIPAIPFPNHYIIVDTRTNYARIYRLAATP